MTTARKHASDLQAFLLMHKLTHQVQEEENRFQSFLEIQGLMTTTFTFKPNSELSSSCWSSMANNVVPELVHINNKIFLLMHLNSVRSSVQIKRGGGRFLFNINNTYCIF
jgi:hypothetical protein